MLWGLPEIRRRVAVEGSVRLSRAEIFLLCGDCEGMEAVFNEEADEALRSELLSADLQVFEAAGEWYISRA
ncbi:hypothetical protein [Massilia oculi]|uniref:hypothetical protein n=1 Tax=Massilia oculi TaxID=945844 RepID=UPI0028AB5AF0|nr:hypothetical protein [Massilia oculi]